MIAFVLMSDPGQVGITRCLVRAALEYRGLGDLAEDAEMITSELVTNAIQHAARDVSDKVGVTLLHVWNRKWIAVVVTDPSPVPPVMRRATAGTEHGRGLRIVDRLSAEWNWSREGSGKAVYAILAPEEQVS